MVAATVGLVVIWTRQNKSREKTRGNVRNTWARERRGYQDEEYRVHISRFHDGEWCK